MSDERDRNESAVQINQSRQESLIDGDADDGDARMNMEMALGKAGGFGLFQYLSMLGLGLTRNSGAPLFYLIAYLTMAQTYNCRLEEGADFVPCDAADVICPARAAGTFIEYEVDTTSATYMNNWQQQMDLMC